MLRAICRDSNGWHALKDVSTISELIKESRTLVWAFDDVSQLEADLETINEEFGLDPLALEDAMRFKQRPKLEEYANHLFAVMHQIDEVDGQFEARQIACFIGRRFVLTLHESSQRTIDAAIERLRRQEPAAGPTEVMHVLLDTIVDEYDELADQLEEEAEAIEDRVLRTPTIDVQRQLYSLKQRLSRLRRYATAGEKVLGGFVQTSGSIAQEMLPHFRDVHDHTQRIIEQVENVNSITDALLDLQRSAHANALNETTKRLTGWAAIIAVPTFIASVYGMNFRLLPRDQTIAGFWFALGLMAITSAVLYTYFKRKDWI